MLCVVVLLFWCVVECVVVVVVVCCCFVVLFICQHISHSLPNAPDPQRMLHPQKNNMDVYSHPHPGRNPTNL